MKPLRNLAAICMGLWAASAFGASPLRMELRPTFTGPFAGTSVITVQLENDGADASGVVRVPGSAGDVLYPVELPRGSRKRLLTLPNVEWGEMRFVLETNQGNVARTMMAEPQGADMGGSVLLIGDDDGALGFLRKQKDEKRTIVTRDAYATAESAPDRLAAYTGFTAVMLGPGAERVTDGTVQALKQFALSGGTLIFTGGASAPTLEDRRWAATLPGRGWQPRTLTHSAVLDQLGGESVSGSFTLLAPRELSSGAIVERDADTILESRRGFGLGNVVVLGYSPLDAPLSTWGGRVKALSRLVRPNDGQRAKQFTANYLNQSLSGDGGSYSYTTSGPMGATTTVTYTSSGGGPTPAMRVNPDDIGDPFSTTLPPTSTVFGILAAYFVLVVPVSFLVLRKMKRGELAWITAPLLSLGFAGLLFKSAEGLYSAALSTASRGVIVLQEGDPQGMFFGTSQMFFPRGGVYDLKLSGVDSMTGVQVNDDFRYSSYGRTSDALAGFNAIDVGEIKAPRLEASNLAFRELSYRQRVEGGDWFRFTRTDAGHVTIENRSPYDFQGTLINSVYESAPFSLSPGSKKSIATATGDRAAVGSSLSVDDPRNFTRYSGRVALRGTIVGFRPGPQLGKEVKNRSGVALVAFAQETVR